MGESRSYRTLPLMLLESFRHVVSPFPPTSSDFCCLKYVSRSLTVLVKRHEKQITIFHYLGDHYVTIISKGRSFLLYLGNRFYDSSSTCIRTWILRWLHTKLLCQNIQEVRDLSLDDSEVCKFCIDILYCKYFPFLWIWECWSVWDWNICF